MATFASSVVQANSEKCVTIENGLNENIYVGLSLLNTVHFNSEYLTKGSDKELCIDEVSDTIDGGFLILGNEESSIECRVNVEKSYVAQHLNDCSGLIKR